MSSTSSELFSHVMLHDGTIIYLYICAIYKNTQVYLKYLKYICLYITHVLYKAHILYILDFIRLHFVSLYLGYMQWQQGWIQSEFNLMYKYQSRRVPGTYRPPPVLLHRGASWKASLHWCDAHRFDPRRLSVLRVVRSKRRQLAAVTAECWSPTCAVSRCSPESVNRSWHPSMPRLRGTAATRWVDENRAGLGLITLEPAGVPAG